MTDKLQDLQRLKRFAHRWIVESPLTDVMSKFEKKLLFSEGLLEQDSGWKRMDVPISSQDVPMPNVEDIRVQVKKFMTETYKVVMTLAPVSGPHYDKIDKIQSEVEEEDWPIVEKQSQLKTKVKESMEQAAGTKKDVVELAAQIYQRQIQNAVNFNTPIKWEEHLKSFPHIHEHYQLQGCSSHADTPIFCNLVHNSAHRYESFVHDPAVNAGRNFFDIHHKPDVWCLENAHVIIDSLGEDEGSHPVLTRKESPGKITITFKNPTVAAFVKQLLISWEFKDPYVWDGVSVLTKRQRYKRGNVKNYSLDRAITGLSVYEKRYAAAVA